MANVMTQEGLDALRAELEDLEGRGRNEIAQQIKTAREWGDLKENAEYHAAKDAQAHLETRILQIRDQIDTATVVEAVSGGDTVRLGVTVEVEDDAGKRSSYEMVSTRDAAPAQGRLSFDSPVGSALRDKRVGQTALVQTPRGERKLKIVAVS